MFRNEGELIFGAWELFAVVDYFAQLKLPLRHFQNEAGQRLTEFCQENTLVIENILFQQQRDDSTHGHYQMVHTKIRLIIFFVAKDGEALYSQQKKRVGADCGSDHELLIAKLRLEESRENH